MIEIHRCIGRSGCYGGRNGAVMAVTACYTLLRNGSELLLSKKYKKVKNGGREIERRGKLEKIERENREDEEHVIDLFKL